MAPAFVAAKGVRVRISNELKLAVDCCSATFIGSAEEAHFGIPQDIDWQRFLRTARFHRVQGLVGQGLNLSRGEIPASVTDALASDATAIAATNLRAATESRQLLEGFDKAEIPALFVKGLPVGALAYRTPLRKMSWDLDVLIAPGQVLEAATVLRDHGYRTIIPASLDRLGAWHDRFKESIWERAGTIPVELHARLSDNPRLLPGIGVHSPRQWVEVAPTVRLPTLADDELFAHLCVHGASSAWFRLKWVTDLAGFLHRRSAAEKERLYDRSQELGAGRAAAQALLLADALYGSLGQGALSERLAKDRVGGWLAGIALRQVAGRTEPREPTTAPFGTAAIHVTQLSMAPGIAFKFSELSRQIGHAIGSAPYRRSR